MADTEGGRIARIIANAQTCAAMEALARARALRAGAACTSCGPQGMALGPQTPSEGAALDVRVARLLRCGVQATEGCVPESVRIARLDSCVINAGPQFRVDKFIPPPCPPVTYSRVVVDETGQVIGAPSLGGNISGNPSILQGKVCPLPNKPDFPVLPG